MNIEEIIGQVSTAFVRNRPIPEASISDGEI
jgi:hypothetical protein